MNVELFEALGNLPGPEAHPAKDAGGAFARLLASGVPAAEGEAPPGRSPRPDPPATGDEPTPAEGRPAQGETDPVVQLDDEAVQALVAGPLAALVESLLAPAESRLLSGGAQPPASGVAGLVPEPALLTAAGSQPTPPAATAPASADPQPGLPDSPLLQGPALAARPEGQPAAPTRPRPDVPPAIAPRAPEPMVSALAPIAPHPAGRATEFLPRPGRLPSLVLAAPAESVRHAAAESLAPSLFPPAVPPQPQPSVWLQLQQGPFRISAEPSPPPLPAGAAPAPLVGDPLPSLPESGPVHDIRLFAGAGDSLDLLLGVSTEKDRAEVQAETPSLASDLAGVGAKVEAIRVELAGRPPQEGLAGAASGQSPAPGPGAGHPGKEDPPARHAGRTEPTARAAEAARRVDHGGKVDRYA